jgi:phosphate starvation-inducible PhoH-like protein
MKNKLTNLYTPKSPNQILYNDILDKDNDYLLSVVGPAGTGKTFLACLKGIEKLKENKVEKIIITRPIVSVEEENIGFLPGNLEKKMDPWVRPIYDVFLEFYTKKEVNDLIFNNKLEISPLGFMRGRTFKNSLVIADEMQNSTPNQMLMLLTRLGINSKIVVTGDLNQSDLGKKNGLKDLIEKMEKKTYENCYLVKLDETDVQRSNIVNKVLKMYKKEEIIENNDAALMPINNVSKNYKKYEIIKNNDAALMPINNVSKNYKKYEIIKNNDAALIPINHVSKNYNKYKIIKNNDAALIPMNHVSKNYEKGEFIYTLEDLKWDKKQLKDN